MLGAERLVYGSLGESLFTARHRRAPLPHPKIGDIVRIARRRRSTCTGSTRRRRRASAPERAMRSDGALALSALDRAPRRRQAGAREHAGRVSRRREPRLSRLRMRRQAQRRRRALPAARRDAAAHDQRPRPRRRRWPGPSCRGSTPAAGTAAPSPASRCRASRRSRAFCLRNGYALEHRDQADARAASAETGARRRRARRRRLWRGAAAAAAAQLVPARRARRRARDAAPELPRALLLDTPARRLARRGAGARLRRRRHRTTR